MRRRGGDLDPRDSAFLAAHSALSHLNKPFLGLRPAAAGLRPRL